MATEHVCREHMATHDGRPVKCECGHLSAGFVMIPRPGHDMPLRICYDCAAPALREWYVTQQRLARAVDDIRAAEGRRSS